MVWNNICIAIWKYAIQSVQRTFRHEAEINSSQLTGKLKDSYRD